MLKTGNKTKKIRKGDKVLAIAGNYRGQMGTVIRCDGDKVIVQGLNVRKKHVKKSQTHPQGGIIEIERPIHVSNLKPCLDDGQPINLKVQTNDKGERELVYKQGDKDIVYRSLKKS
jgi:large subunit ribosomal protein L24